MTRRPGNPHPQAGVSTRTAIIHSKAETRRQWHKKLLGSDSGDGHGMVWFIFSSLYSNMFHVRGNTVTQNYSLAQILIPIPCFGQLRLDILPCLVQTLTPFIIPQSAKKQSPSVKGNSFLPVPRGSPSLCSISVSLRGPFPLLYSNFM